MTLATPSPKLRWLIFFGLAVLALAIRLPQLDQRPMHTDEAVNGYITGELLAGKPYRYDPQDRHGPALYLVAAPLARVCGATQLADLTEKELRLTNVLIGSATVLMFGAAVGLFGFLPCLIAALLFAVGPLSVYYSRYFIHETLFVAATFGVIISGGYALKKNSLPLAALAGFCAALMLASKETAAIHFFSLAVAGGVTAWFSRDRTRPDWFKSLSVAAAVFIIGTVLFFSWFGQSWASLGELFHAIPNFAARAGGQGHEKPFTYYFGIVDPLSIFFIVGAAGVYAVLCDAAERRRRAGLFLLVYSGLIFMIYSCIPYKTPWLALNFWLPLTLLCGLGVEGVWQQFQNSTGRWIAVIAVAALVFTAGESTKTLAFDHPADERNPLAYAHTTDDILGLPVRLNELCRERQLTNPRITVIAKDAWPLPWYLRKFSRVGYWQPDQETGAADFYITPSDLDGKLAEQLREYRPEFFGVRPNVLFILWIPPVQGSTGGASVPASRATGTATP